MDITAKPRTTHPTSRGGGKEKAEGGRGTRHTQNTNAGGRRLHSMPHHVLGASLGGKHGQDARAAAHVQDDFVLEQVGVLHDGVAVGEGADFVLEHFLWDGRQSG